MGPVGRLKSELIYLAGMIRMVRRMAPVVKDRHRIWPAEFKRLAARHGDRPALVSDTESLTYRQLDARADRWARWALAMGLAKGETVALLMESRPEYVAVWLGITRAGGAVALLNTGQTGASLAHSIDVAAPRHVIVSAAVADGFSAARPLLRCTPRVWSHGPGPDEPVEPVLEALPPGPPDSASLPEITTEDRCLLIYTSGTTGLPKAANVNHYRTHAMIRVFTAAMRVRADDRMYIALPLYHTSGGVLAVCTMLAAGATAVIAPRFSARTFWDDVVRHQCTMFQYIGEICRYLLAAPPHPLERAHRLRLLCGNGLRPEVWAAFCTRFAIPRVLEWYASTEGNAVIFNLDGRVGSVGRIPRWAESRLPSRLVRLNDTCDDVVRGPDGLCVPCADDEPGELVAEIVHGSRRPGQRFEGYTSADAGRSKILTDVFRKGDCWFRTGDMMRRDRLGYFTFVDRLGDTFRWKGENVSTTEVAAAVAAFPGVLTAAVYGVEVPGADGKAGMATVEVEPGGTLDLVGLAEHLARTLPPYARPLFLRVTAQMDTTGTFKPRKVDLARDGYDLSRVSDPLYLLHPQSRRYEPLDARLREALVAGTVRL